MCGIVGYSGSGNAIPKITKGLGILEYRGYDSVGIGTVRNGKPNILKCGGRVDTLLKKIEETNFKGANCAIGHTRWATHGAPTDKNAHPHAAPSLLLVHNGIIENYRKLKENSEQKGTRFLSETDSEVAAFVISEEYERTKDPVRAIYAALSRIEGSYAFEIIFNDYPNNIYAVRKGSPLIIGNGTDGKYCASDITALLPFLNEVYYLSENEIAVINGEKVSIVADNGDVKQPTWQTTEITANSAQKCGYKHFMLKEINEQPEAFLKTVRPRIVDGLPELKTDGISDDVLKNAQRIFIVACGSAMHAGLVGKSITEDMARVPVSVEIASEFRYKNPIIEKNDLVIIISQSGETADSLAALRYAKENGAFVFGIVNVVGSAIAREADAVMYTFAGPEIAVATTKGYCVQIAALGLIAARLALIKGVKTEQEIKEFCSQMVFETPVAIEESIKMQNEIKKAAKAFYKRENIFFIGRGTDYALCAEGSLKLKEISYIHSEAYAAGELKHGTISLIEKGTPVIALCTDERLYKKTVSNIRECSSRGADVLLVCNKGAEGAKQVADKVLELPECKGFARIFAAVTVCQLLAYEVAQLRKCDIDKPRNLAKSVTVE